MILTIGIRGRAGIGFIEADEGPLEISRGFARNTRISGTGNAELVPNAHRRRVHISVGSASLHTTLRFERTSLCSAGISLGF